MRGPTVTEGAGLVEVGDAVISGAHVARKMANIVSSTRSLLFNMDGSFRNIARSDNNVTQRIASQPV
jgi:hypothetical protein